MKAARIHERGGAEGLVFEDAPEPKPVPGDVVVRVRAAGLVPDELEWPGAWVDRAGHDRTPTIPSSEVAGVIAGLGYGTTGFTVGQRVFGLTDWTRDGAAAEFVAVEARNLAPMPEKADFIQAAALPMSGLTAWQALHVHGGVEAGQTVLIHGAGGGVGTLAVQLAKEAGARVIGTGRGAAEPVATELGADLFVALDGETPFEQVAGQADLVFDTIGGDVLARSAAMVKPRGTLVTISAPPVVEPAGARSVFFIVEPSREQLIELAKRFDEGRLRSHVGAVYPLSETREAFQAKQRGIPGKVVLQV